MKKPETLLKEYVTRLSDENLKFANGRLTQRLAGDLPEVLDFFSKSNDMDRWLSSAKTCDDFYNMLDFAHKVLDKEYTKRFGDA